MTTITCTVAVLLAVLTIPAVVLWRCTLTKQQHAKRLRSRGLPYRLIAKHLNCSPSTARRYCLA